MDETAPMVELGPGEYLNVDATNNNGNPTRVVLVDCDASSEGCSTNPSHPDVLQDSGSGYGMRAVSYQHPFQPSHYYSVAIIGANGSGFCDYYGQCTEARIEKISIDYNHPTCSGGGGSGGGSGGGNDILASVSGNQRLRHYRHHSATSSLRFGP